MLRAVLYGVLLGSALILSAWMGMADAKTSGKRSVLRITAPVKVEPAAPAANHSQSAARLSP